jgi:hypothetical protein
MARQLTGRIDVWWNLATEEGEFEQDRREDSA